MDADRLGLVGIADSQSLNSIASQSCMFYLWSWLNMGF